MHYLGPEKEVSCLLPPASCLLPPASCLLPPASCLLPPSPCLATTPSPEQTLPLQSLLLLRQPATLPCLPQVLLLPLFSELAVLCPAATITVVMVGPLGIALPPPISFEGTRGGRVTVSVLRGLYHDLTLPSPDLAIAPNAGLAIPGYETRWPATLRHLQQRATPFVFSDYSEQGVEKGLAFALHHAALVPSCGVQLNPFRAPMRLSQVHGGSVGHPTLSNGFFAAFNTPPTAFDAAPE